MDREVLLAYIDLEEQHIRKAEELLRRAHHVVERMERDELDTSRARDVLRAFEESLALHVLSYDRLREEFRRNADA